MFPFLVYLALRVATFYYFLKLCFEVIHLFIGLNNLFPRPWYADDPWVFLMVVLVLASFYQFLFDDGEEK